MGFPGLATSFFLLGTGSTCFFNEAKTPPSKSSNKILGTAETSNRIARGLSVSDPRLMTEQASLACLAAQKQNSEICPLVVSIDARVVVIIKMR